MLCWWVERFSRKRRGVRQGDVDAVGCVFEGPKTGGRRFECACASPLLVGRRGLADWKLPQLP